MQRLFAAPDSVRVETGVLRFAAFAIVFVTARLGAQNPAAEDHITAAKRAESSGDLAAAEREYDQALAGRPDAEIFQRLGLVRHLQNKYSGAIPAFEEAVRLKPALWGAHLFLGIDYYRTNQFEKALPSLKLAERLKPDEPEIQFWLGATHLALKQFLSGAETLERLVQRQPANAEALRLLAQHYSNYGTALLNGVAEQFPETAAGYQVHGLALEAEGAYAAAIEAWRTALAIEPRRRGLHESIARALWAENKTKEAVAEFRTELVMQPAAPEANFYLGTALLLEQHYPEARKYLQTACLWNHQSAAPEIALARVDLALADSAKAAEAAERAITLEPASEEAHQVLLTALAQINQQAGIVKEQERWRRIKATP